MIFGQDKAMEILGEKVGYLFSYFLFTTILFLILVLLKKIPETWSYAHIMGITILIALIGSIIKISLK